MCGQFGLCYFMFFFYNIKINHFLYRFIILLRLIFSFLRIILLPYAYVSTESIDCILLSSIELREILLISSVKTVCLSLIKLFCFVVFFNIGFLYFMVLLRPSESVPFFSKYFIIFLI